MIIAFFIFILLVVNTIFASNMSDIVQNTYLRRLMILPPFGLLAFIVLTILALGILAMETFKDLWNQ